MHSAPFQARCREGCEAVASFVIARLALGAARASSSAPQVEDVAAVVRAVRASRVPIADLPPREFPDLAWLLGSAPYRELLAEQRSRQERYLAEFEKFLARARRVDLPVLVMKACDAFPYESSNLDLLVPSERMQEAASILDDSGFLHLRHYRETHKTLHKKFRGGREVAIFHLHQEISWDGAVFLDRGTVWAERRPLASVAGAWQPSRRHQAALTIAHAVYENGDVRVTDLRRVLRALGDGDGFADALAEEARDRGWSTGLRLGIEALVVLERETCGTARVAAGFRAVLSRRHGVPRARSPHIGHLRARLLLAGKILRSRADPWPARIGLLLRYVLAKARAALGPPRHRALLVALSGVDGAGKSLYARGLVSMLDNCDLTTKVVWARGGSTRPLLWLKSALRFLSGNRGPAAVRQEGVSLGPAWQRVLWPWIVSCELVITHAFRMAPALLRRRVVVSDRHILDAAVDLSDRLDGYDPRRLICWRALNILAPRPDLHLLFDVAPEEAMRRKDTGMDRPQLERRRRLFLEWARPDAIVVATERDPDEVLDEIGRLVAGMATGPRP